MSEQTEEKTGSGVVGAVAATAIGLFIFNREEPLISACKPLKKSVGKKFYKDFLEIVKTFTYKHL